MATRRASPSISPRATRFDLIEALAAHIADALLARLPLERATVTVHKPEAPLGLEFDDVSVTVSARARAVVACADGRATVRIGTTDLSLLSGG